MAILVGSRDHRTQFWKGAIQGPFHHSLVAIGPVVSEEKIFMEFTFIYIIFSYKDQQVKSDTSNIQNDTSNTRDTSNTQNNTSNTK